MNKSNIQKIRIPPQFQFLFKPRRYKIMYSGRAAAKSWTIAIALLTLGTQSKLRILCCRELQASMDDSVHKLLSDMNSKYDLKYIVTRKSIIHPVTGTEFIFEGLRMNITKIKSFEGIDIAWIEEAETISETSLEILIPTIRKEKSEIWVSFNPSAVDDAVYKKFVTPYMNDLTDNSKYVDNRHYILKTHYSKNPFLPETIKEEIAALKEQNFREYLHVYGGDPIAVSDDAIIDPEWFDAAIDAHKVLNFKAKGMKVIGFDPADIGKDAKASINRYGSIVEGIDQWTDGDLEEAIEKVYNKAVDLYINEIVYDGTGLGAGAKMKFNSFDPKHRIVNTSFIAAAKPDYYNDKYLDDITNKDMFRNKRAQYYWLLRDRFYNTYRAVVHQELSEYKTEDLISISSNCDYIDELKAELTKIQRKRVGNSSLIQIESKQEMRKRGVKSPNLADALTYVFANTPTIQTTKYKQLNINSYWN